MPLTGTSSSFVSATHNPSSTRRLSPGVDEGTTANVISPIRLKHTWMTSLAMIAFAGNSLLCRAALRTGAIDAASFTAIRLATGAAVVALIVLARRASLRGEGTWTSAFALAGYAVAFSYAYLRIGAAAGALILFGSVQLTMIVGGLVRGERPT